MRPADLPESNLAARPRWKLPWNHTTVYNAAHHGVAAHDHAARQVSAATLSRLPNLVIAGVGKSGTTSLFWYLSQHPDICASQLKEVNYFSPLRNDESPDSLATYVGYFAHCTGEPYRMEASPAYFYGGPRVIRGVRETLPEPRVLISLRDPVTRLWSAFSFLKSMGRLDSDLSFARYVEDCCQQLAEDAATPPESRRQTPLSVGFYDQHLGTWFDHFGDSLRILFAEDLFTRPLAVVSDLCAWLGIDESAAASIDYQVHNQTVRPKSHQLATWAYRGQVVSDRLFRSHPLVRRSLRRVYATINGRRTDDELDPQQRRRLQELYQPSIAATARQLTLRGYRTLPDWLTVL